LREGCPPPYRFTKTQLVNTGSSLSFEAVVTAPAPGIVIEDRFIKNPNL
jgi:hypothetical protein